jgi:hypothetical protein
MGNLINRLIKKNDANGGLIFVEPDPVGKMLDRKENISAAAEDFVDVPEKAEVSPPRPEIVERRQESKTPPRPYDDPLLALLKINQVKPETPSARPAETPDSKPGYKTAVINQPDEKLTDIEEDVLEEVADTEPERTWISLIALSRNKLKAGDYASDDRKNNHECCFTGCQYSVTGETKTGPQPVKPAPEEPQNQKTPVESKPGKQVSRFSR